MFDVSRASMCCIDPINITYFWGELSFFVVVKWYQDQNNFNSWPTAQESLSVFPPGSNTMRLQRMRSPSTSGLSQTTATNNEVLMDSSEESSWYNLQAGKNSNYLKWGIIFYFHNLFSQFVFIRRVIIFRLLWIKFIHKIS